MKKTVAVIGAGYWGKNLVRNFHQLGALHTICDHHTETLGNFKKLYPDVSVTSDYSAVLGNKEITKVVIATPAIFHYQNTKDALLAGKDVYVEKPFCLNSTEGEELVKLAEKQKRILMVGHLLHYHPCVERLQKCLKDGELGTLQYIVSNRLNLGSYRTEENALWNFAPHDISVILSLCNHQIPEKVYCMGGDYLTPNVADKAITLLSFSNGVRAHIFVSWLNPFKEQKLTVVGTKGMVVFDDTKPWGEKLNLFLNHVTWNGNKPIANQVTPTNIDPLPQEPLKQECLHFLECCEKRTTPRTDGHEGLRVTKVLEAAQISLNS
jgi:UDP-2-acetamido-3-amino-2,3-dideoxy-glucuronate N-acetyltransferase